MKRLFSPALAALAAVALLSAPAHAVLRVPQVVFNPANLTAQLTSFGEGSINVLTQQQDGLVWGSTVSTNATMTIQFELAGNPHADEIGIAAINSAGNVSALDPVFPALNLQPGWFAVASFRSGGILKVNLFDPTATASGPTLTYTGVNRSWFAYYLKNANGVFYSHEGYNLDGKVHALVYAGTGQNTGSWWMTWEDNLNPGTSDDYADGLIFLESMNPTPVSHSTWSAVKARFR